MAKITPLPGVAYLAPEGFEHLTAQELRSYPHRRYGRLFVVSEKPAKPVYWYDNCWEQLQRVDIESIGSAAKALRSIQRNWWPYLPSHFRRGTLIQEALPHISAQPLQFGQQVPTAPLGSWTLLDEKQLLASAHCTSGRPNGLWQFVEDKQGPPSRAYLKLWEAFMRFGFSPSSGERCIELGASPGGWTWVLAKGGAQVIAYDRSPLRDDLMASPQVQFVKGDAFSVTIDQLNQVDWLFSDVICYPQKLYDFIFEKVLPSTLKRAVCTIKLQGESYPAELIEKFAALPHSQVVHLSVNKHELTWLYGV
jgi:23S rRNA (cytidine2498-2'-O)-methyltransferase